jgi:1,4-dihydroxy-2-naphthoate octaprenyltransferase
VTVDDALGTLSRYSHAILVWRTASGYPMNVATDFRVEQGAVELTPAKSGGQLIPADSGVQVVFSRIRPRAGVGYDERSYLEFAGTMHADGNIWRFRPDKVNGWDEASLPFFELCERAVPQARRYLAQLSLERGTKVEPRMSAGWRLFLATRAPFLTATLVPVLLGAAAAATFDRRFSWALLLLTMIGAVCAHLGLNIANDLFDARSGADDANVTPTMFSGGSRVIQYGLVSVRQMAALCGAFYAVAIGIGLVLVALSGTGLLWLGLAGLLLSWFYTAPPLKLVYRGFGELAVAIGFGPIMVLGAYFVQTGHYAWKPALLSVPVALLIMLVLYANEIPDRAADASTHKRTLVVRLSPAAVVAGYAVAVAAAYASLVAAVAAHVLPWPLLLGLLTIPLAVQVVRGLRRDYDRPYEVMASLQRNVLLHLGTGVLLIAGTLVGALTG